MARSAARFRLAAMTTAPGRGYSAAGTDTGHTGGSASSASGIRRRSPTSVGARCTRRRRRPRESSPPTTKLVRGSRIGMAAPPADASAMKEAQVSVSGPISTASLPVRLDSTGPDVPRRPCMSRQARRGKTISRRPTSMHNGNVLRPTDDRTSVGGGGGGGGGGGPNFVLLKVMWDLGDRSNITKATMKPTPIRAAVIVGPLSQPCSGASMRANTMATTPIVDSTAPRRVERRLVRVARRRHQPRAEADGPEHERHVDQEHRAPPEVGEERAADQRPEAATGAGEARPDGDRLGAFVRREDVDQDRQRRRHDERRADAHHATADDQLRSSTS